MRCFLFLSSFRGSVQRVIIDYTHAGLFKLDGSTLVALAVRGPKPLEQAMPFQIRLQSLETLTLLLNERRSTRIGDVQSADPPAQFSARCWLTRPAFFWRVCSRGCGSRLPLRARSLGRWVWRIQREISSLPITPAWLSHVANQAAITMVNAELYENAQALATLQERQRLAQNLHDAVNQSLFSAGLIAEVLPRLWEHDPEEGRRSLEDLRRLTRARRPICACCWLSCGLRP